MGKKGDARAAQKKKKRIAEGAQSVAENRRARFEYHITETLETGIVLVGTEVKAIRDGRVSLAEGYVRARSEPRLELELIGVNIGEYAPAGVRQHRPKRSRKLLAHRREILKLAKATEEKGATIVPLKMYFKDGWAKVLIGLAQGKTKGDKRQDIKKRDAERDIRRALSKRA